MDILQKYYEFAKNVAAAAPPPPEEKNVHYAIMIMVHAPKESPVGGALNFIGGKWEVQAEMGEVSPIVEQ